jgi:hypothetical protein
MRLLQTFSTLFDPAPIVRASRIRIGRTARLQGVPAILVGVSCIVVAGGIARALERATPVLPDTFREARSFWESLRRDRPPLNP